MNKKQLKALQEKFADADYIPEDAIPDAKPVRLRPLSPGQKSSHRQQAHRNCPPQRVLDRMAAEVIARGWGAKANAEWAAELRRRREVELAERLARWEAQQGGEAELRKCMDCPTMLPADGKRRCQPCADRKAVRDKRTRDIRNARRKAATPQGTAVIARKRPRVIEVIMELDEDYARYGDDGEFNADRLPPNHADGGVAATESAF